MEIVFIDSSLCYNGVTPYFQPLGGSSSAAVYLSRGLADLGHEVIYYNHTLGEPRMYKGVDYRHLFNMVEDSKEMPDVDVVMVIRDPRPLIHWEGGGLRVVRIQDDVDQPVIQHILQPMCRVKVDHIMGVSDWQLSRFIKISDWPRSKSTVIPNGIPHWNFSSEFPGKVGNRMAYCSTPFRGLEQLLDIFPLIRREVPDAELHIYSDMKVYQYAQEEDDGSFGELYEALAGVPGIVYHGSVGQRELAKGLEKCKVLSYPNTFRETSCIAQLEAQAAGNVVVTSGIGALPETVGPHGFLIPGFPGQDNYNEVFADKCIALLKYEVGWKKLAVEARQWAWENHSYEVISKQTELTLEKLIANKGSIKCLL